VVPCVRFGCSVRDHLLGIRNTRYEWLVKPYSAGTRTPQEAPSFAWRTNVVFSCGVAWRGPGCVQGRSGSDPCAATGRTLVSPPLCQGRDRSDRQLQNTVRRLTPKRCDRGPCHLVSESSSAIGRCPDETRFLDRPPSKPDLYRLVTGSLGLRKAAKEVRQPQARMLFEAPGYRSQKPRHFRLRTAVRGQCYLTVSSPTKPAFFLRPSNVYSAELDKSVDNLFRAAELEDKRVRAGLANAAK
jgi:hypothetical protein